MQIYEPTPLGQDIASRSGLEALAIRLQAKERLSSLIVGLTTDHDITTFDDYGTVAATAIRESYARLTSEDERHTLVRGLQIDPEHHQWGHVEGLVEDGLFPMPNVRPFRPATKEDALVLSGVAGLQLLNYRRDCRLLSRSRYQEYGFGDFAQSCAFAGAYVVGKIVDLDKKQLTQHEPKFSFDRQGVNHQISIYGSFHGDFRIRQDRLMTGDIVSPVGTSTEFGPKDSLEIAGYHSIESNIAASMILYQYLRDGRVGSTKLLSELTEVVKPLIDARGNIDYERGNFADYGDIGSSFILDRLGLALEDDDYAARLKADRTIYSEPYLPQSSYLFEIVGLEAGLRFQNRNDQDDKPAKKIDIDQAHFAQLFSALTTQTQFGFGRTAPYQLLGILEASQRMLAE